MNSFDRSLVIIALLSLLALVIILGVRVGRLEDRRIVEPVSKESVSLLWRDVQHISVPLTHISDPSYR